MSLIYDALRTTGETPVAPGKQPARSATVRGLPRGSVWLFVGALLAGPLGFLVARGTGSSAAAGQPPLPPATPAPAAIAVAPPASTTPATLPVASAAANSGVATTAVAAATPISVTAATSVAATLPVAATAQTDATATTTTQPAAITEATPPAIHISVSSTGKAPIEHAAGNKEEPDPVAVRGAMARLHAAVGDHDPQGQEQALAELGKLLPDDSLTLLRARAWAAHGSGDSAQAERLYGAILQRVPDDEYASVNLALLDARRGAVEQARDRLNQLAARGHSPMVDNALAELENSQP